MDVAGWHPEDVHVILEQPDPPSLGDHQLIHHFIRTSGRRPSPSELAALRARDVTRRSHRVGARLTFAQVLRREAARLVHRL